MSVSCVGGYTLLHLTPQVLPFDINDNMQSRYHSNYKYPSYQSSTAATAFPSSLPNPLDDVFRDVFYDFDSDGYYKLSEDPAIRDLEKARKNYSAKRVSLSTHLDTAVELLKSLDTTVPVFRKAGAIIRYLPIDILVKLRENDFTANLLDKLIHYFHLLDWKNLLKALAGDRDYLLSNGCSQYSVKDEKENDDYIVAALQQTLNYERKTRSGRRTSGLSSSPTPSKRRRRSGEAPQLPPSTPEHQVLPICPLLTNMR